MIIGMLILSGISMTCLGLYNGRFAHRIPAAVPYSLLMISAATWAVLYALNLLIPRVRYENNYPLSEDPDDYTDNHNNPSRNPEAVLAVPG